MRDLANCKSHRGKPSDSRPAVFFVYRRMIWVALSGLAFGGRTITQGVALGCYKRPLQGRKRQDRGVASPTSKGHGPPSRFLTGAVRYESRAPDPNPDRKGGAVDDSAHTPEPCGTTLPLYGRGAACWPLPYGRGSVCGSLPYGRADGCWPLPYGRGSVCGSLPYGRADGCWPLPYGRGSVCGLLPYGRADGCWPLPYGRGSVCGLLPFGRGSVCGRLY